MLGCSLSMIEWWQIMWPKDHSPYTLRYLQNHYSQQFGTNTWRWIVTKTSRELLAKKILCYKCQISSPVSLWNLDETSFFFFGHFKLETFTNWFYNCNPCLINHSGDYVPSFEFWMQFILDIWAKQSFSSYFKLEVATTWGKTFACFSIESLRSPRAKFQVSSIISL